MWFINKKTGLKFEITGKWLEYVGPDLEPIQEDLSSLKRHELMTMAKDKGLEFSNTVKKQELIEMLGGE